MIGRIVTISHSVLLAEGRRRRLIAVAAGAVGALALAPLGLLPALWLSLPVAVWLIDGVVAAPTRFSPAPLLSAAKDGWWFGFGYFLAGFWWIGAAFLVETDEFAWAMPLGVLGLPAGLAFFFALAFAIARLLWSPGVWRIFALAAGFGLAELLRHVAFTGFPWNAYGQALGAWLVFAQAASAIGAEGLTLLAVLIFAAPATLVDGAARPLRPALVGLAALVALGGYGLARLELAGGVRAAAGAADVVPGVRLRLVQPNMSQRDKINETDGLAVLNRLFALSDRAAGPQATGMTDATHVIWPESPFPFVLAREPRAMAEIARALPPKTVLLTGAVRVEDVPRAERRYYNTIHAFGGPGGALVTSYDKVHLVPFGEYLPFEKLLGAIGLRRFVHAPGSFTPGSARRLMDVPGLPPVLPLICYEAIFPFEIDGKGPRPGLILNVTNDAWFGETTGPHQHFAQARLRAVEFGLPVVRVANTGVSGMIDAHGRVSGVMGLGTEGVSDVALPKALPRTLFAAYGLEIILSLLAAVLGLAVLAPWAAAFRNRRRAFPR